MLSDSNQNSIIRLKELTNSDLDYSELESEFKNLIRLAKSITGLEVSLLNLIDAHHLWPISQNGAQFGVMPLQDTPCQYTVTNDDFFEVKDLPSHDLLKDKDYVKKAPFYKYYIGVPLKTENGINIGSLCFFDTKSRGLNPSQILSIQIIAQEVVAKIEVIKAQNNLRKEFFEYRSNQRIMANELRNPLAGIIGLSDVLIEQFDDIEKDEAKDYNLLINSSSKSILSTLDDIIINQKRQKTETNTLNLDTLKALLISLYSPLLRIQNLKLAITSSEEKSNILFLKSNVSFLVGNLLAEALLNIPEKGVLNLSLDLIVKVNQLYFKAEYSSETLLNMEDSVENEFLKVYQNKITELGGELVLKSKPNQLYELTLPLKNI